jgi:hypothetical protein
VWKSTLQKHQVSTNTPREPHLVIKTIKTSESWFSNEQLEMVALITLDFLLWSTLTLQSLTDVAMPRYYWTTKLLKKTELLVINIYLQKDVKLIQQRQVLYGLSCTTSQYVEHWNPSQPSFNCSLLLLSSSPTINDV